MNKSLKVVISGGGTGGHFFPAMAIKEALVKKGIRIKYIGSKYGVEANSKNLEENTLFLNITGIQRGLTLKSIKKNILFPFRFLQSYYLSRKLLNEFKPDLVIGTGGYSSGLPLLAAIHLGIKTVIQEQNSFPGITTRYLSNRCDIIFIAYNDARKYLKKKMLFLQEIQLERI